MAIFWDFYCNACEVGRIPCRINPLPLGLTTIATQRDEHSFIVGTRGNEVAHRVGGISECVPDALEPRRMHFNYPPYYPGLLLGLRLELQQRQSLGRFGVMADIPAGAAWYGRQRVWAQPARLRDFYAVTVDQSIGELLLTPRTLDRPFFSELALRGPLVGSLTETSEKFGEWGQIYSGLLTGKVPPEFPLTVPQKLADNLYVLFNPALPPARAK